MHEVQHARTLRVGAGAGEAPQQRAVALNLACGNAPVRLKAKKIAREPLFPRQQQQGKKEAVRRPTSTKLMLRVQFT